MKKLIVTCMCVLGLLTATTRATAPSSVATLSVSPISLYNHDEMRGIELVVGKQKAGTYFTVPVYGLFRNVLDTMSQRTMARATFEFVNIHGDVAVLSACEVDSACSSVPAVILVAPRDRPPTKDTIRLSDAGGGTDLSMLDGLVKEQTRMKRALFQLPDTKVSKAFIAELKASSARLVCPRDRRTLRWLNNIVEIRLTIR